MNRRMFLACTATAISAPAYLLADGSGETVDYKTGLIEQKLAEGKVVFVDFAADWCSTCKRQERILSDLRQSNPAFDEHITFVRVDWDEFGNADVATTRNIPRRSTLVLLKGEEELGRIVAGTSADEIRALLELGLPS